MSTRKANLLTHPMRSRILVALMGRQLTTQQIADLLPDLPLPSLYRHLRLLAENNVVSVVEEVRVNGALTKVYAVEKGQTSIGPSDVAEASHADELRYFTTFLNTLAETYRAYLEQDAEGDAKKVTYALMEPLYLSDEERQAFQASFREFLKPWRENQPDVNRRRVVFAHLAIPDRDDPPIS